MNFINPVLLFQIKISMNVQGIWAIVTRTPIALKMKDRTIALATMDTKEMASTALVITWFSKKRDFFYGIIGYLWLINVKISTDVLKFIDFAINMVALWKQKSIEASNR